MRIRFLFLCFFVLWLAACSAPPPHSHNNICKIFKQYPSWYWASADVRHRWGVPISIQLAIIHQESDFQSHVKPAREKVFGFIPWSRPTSAKGYTQALTETWRRYKKSVDKSLASRSRFSDAVDFIGWYLNQAQDRINITKRDAYIDYLVYHEGALGYSEKTYLKKPWLIGVARKVQRQANLYYTQLKHCEPSLPKKPWWRVW